MNPLLPPAPARAGGGFPWKERSETMKIELAPWPGGHVLKITESRVEVSVIVSSSDGMETADQLIEAAYALAPGSPGERMDWFLDRLAEALL